MMRSLLMLSSCFQPKGLIKTFVLLGFTCHLIAQPDSTGVWTQTDPMPFFTGCESLSADDPGKRPCCDRALAAFFDGSVRYPDSARRAGVEGVAVVSFVVDEQGGVRDAHLLYDPGAGCGAATLAAVRAMPPWEPGLHRGRPVKVRLVLPVRFGFTAPDDDPDWFSLQWGRLAADTTSRDVLLDCLQQPLVVRDPFGSILTVHGLEFVWEKGRMLDAANTPGSRPDAKMRAVVENLTPEGTFTITASVAVGDRLMPVSWSFAVKN